MRSTYEPAGNIKHLAYSLHIRPVLLPLATFVCAGLISSIPISHIDSGKIIVLQNVLDRRVPGMSSGLTSWLSSFATTEESTPPDIPTTTAACHHNVQTLRQ
jgi:hypothetical protein